MTKKVDLVGIDTQYDCDVGGVFDSIPRLSAMIS